MRVLLLLLLSLTLVSCELDLDSEDVAFEKVAIFDVEAPNSLTVNFEYNISFHYALVDGCRSFYNVEFESPSEGVREITAFIEVNSNQNCTSIYVEEQHTFQFKPTQQGDYVFKFWTGVDASGADVFEIKEISVTE